MPAPRFQATVACSRDGRPTVCTTAEPVWTLYIIYIRLTLHLWNKKIHVHVPPVVLLCEYYWISPRKFEGLELELHYFRPSDAFFTWKQNFEQKNSLTRIRRPVAVRIWFRTFWKINNIIKLFDSLRQYMGVTDAVKLKHLSRKQCLMELWAEKMFRRCSRSSRTSSEGRCDSKMASDVTRCRCDASLHFLMFELIVRAVWLHGSGKCQTDPDGTRNLRTWIVRFKRVHDFTRKNPDSLHSAET